MTEPFEPFESAPPPPTHLEPPTQQLPFAGPSQWRQPVWRRRGVLIGGGVGVLAVVGLIIGLVLAGSSGGTPSNTAAAQAGQSSTTPAPADSTGKSGKGHKKGAAKAPAFHLVPGENVLFGTVNSVSQNTVSLSLVGPQGQVTFDVDDSTKVTGAAATGLAALKAGEQVDVVAKGNTAVTIRVVKTS